MKSAVMSSQQFVAQLGESMVHLMGLSFIVGSLFTIFVLLVFDYLRRSPVKPKKKS